MKSFKQFTLASRLVPILAVAVTVVVAGCSSRFGNNGGGNAATVIMPMPATSEVITQSRLPEPYGQNMANQNQMANQDTRNLTTMNAPNAGAVANNANQQNLIPGFEIPFNAMELSPASVAGVWQVAIDGMACQLATPQTKFGKGYRAAPLRCPASLMGVTSWSVNNKILNLYNEGGYIVAMLYSYTANQFEGRSVNGKIITFTR